jgi:hypothetical protein
MWLLTSIGFYSIVEKPTGTICLRARSKADMQAFVELMPGCTKPIHTPQGDYPWRVNVSRSRFNREFYRLAETITYPNFKQKVAETNPERAELYAPVWAHLMEIEREESNQSESGLIGAQPQKGTPEHGESSNQTSN